MQVRALSRMPIHIGFMMRYIKCPYCKKDLTNIQSYANIANHIRWCNLNPKRIEKKKKEKKYQRKFCTLCGKEIFSNKRRIRCDECSHKHTEETKLRMSNARINWLKKNPEKHPWKKKTKFISIPCENLKKYLNSIGLKYVSEYDTYEETNRNFSIDIAFPDIKIGIEINGNQHYNKDGTLKKYYQKRHDIIESCGWKLLEIHYSSCFNEESIKNIITYYEQPDYTKYFENNLKRENKEKLKLEKEYIKHCKIKEKVQKILESNIDFSKFGWVGKVSSLIGIPPQKVHFFMEKNMPTFYKEKCFRRKNINRK